MQTTAPESNKVDALSVAILAGNEVLCRGLEAVLQSLPTVGSVHRCHGREQVMMALQSSTFDVLIVSALDADWLDSVPAATTAARTKILVLLDENATHDLSAYASCAVDGFLAQQDLSAQTLHDALHRCRLGELPMPPALARALLARVDLPTQRTRSANLTGREVETLSLLVRGMSNKQIARRLAISSHGAKRLVASIMLKLDSPNRTTAVVNAIKAGIVDYQ